MSNHTSDPTRARRGFTLVELLVVIAITGILVALLLPAVQAAREAARRSQCTNNLKQIGLALHNYHDVHKSFPIGTVAVPPQFGNMEWPNYLVAILPFCEQQPLYEGFAVMLSQPTARPWTVAFPAQVQDKAVSNYLCPSDGKGGGLNTLYVSRLFKSNYLGIYSGMNEQDAIDEADPAASFDVGQRGAFGFNRSVKFRDILDGMSNTLVAAEHLTGIDERDTRGWPWTARAGRQMLHVQLTPNTNIPDESIPYDGFCLAQNNLPELNLPCIGVWATTNNVAARSRHPGGVNGLLGDGSVDFFSETIDVALWRSLGWISDGGP
jgi:prepilin-type N-terminal cleavage/methylation domain-containing protein/prepilin-type processing-associated H-X9-DG protein